MRFTRFATLFLLLACLITDVPQVSAAVITGGTATWTMEEGKANSISEFDAYFNELTSRSAVLADAAPGNAPFTEAAFVNLSDPIRPFGVMPLTGDGRTRQTTTLDFDSTNASSLLASWSISDDGFGFTGSSTLGEQIALTNMQRWTGPFTGSLVYGDFALRYTGSKLILTSNIDFTNSEFAEIGSPVINISGNTLTISGDLLIGEALTFLDPGAVPGTDFGNFTMTASFTAVPEPSTIGLAVAGGIGILVLARRRRREQLASTF